MPGAGSPLPASGRSLALVPVLLLIGSNLPARGGGGGGGGPRFSVGLFYSVDSAQG